MTTPKYKLAGAMNSRTLRMIRAGLSEMDEIVAINGGKGCVATFELPDVGMVEGANPSPEYLEAIAICDAANKS